MDDIVKQIAKADLSPDLLSKMDMSGLLEGFSLDDKQKDNSEHPQQPEDENAISDWWRSYDLEGAQLQASFSKKLGQLMVITIAQSQLLTQQQQTLQRHQAVIRKQARELENENAAVSQQQKALGGQQEALKKLSDNYQTLKAFTQDSAKQLIATANDGKSTRQALEDVILEHNQAISDLQSLQEEECQLVEDSVNRRIDLVDESLKAAIEDQEQLLSDHQAYQESELRDLQDALDTAKSELSDDLDQTKDFAESWIEKNALDIQSLDEKLDENIAYFGSQLNEALQNTSKTLLDELESRAQQFNADHEEYKESALKREEALSDKIESVQQESRDSAEAHKQTLQQLTESLKSKTSKLRDQNANQNKHLSRIEQGLKSSVSKIGDKLNAHADFSKQLKTSNAKEIKSLQARSDRQDARLSEMIDTFDHRMKRMTLLAYSGIGGAVVALGGLVWVLLGV